MGWERLWEVGEGWEEKLAKGSGVGGCSGQWKRKTQALGPFLSWAYYSGTSSGKLYLLLVMTEHILTHVHDTKPRNTYSCDHQGSGTAPSMGNNTGEIARQGLADRHRHI